VPELLARADNGLRSEDIGFRSALFGCVRRCYRRLLPGSGTEQTGLGHKNGHSTLKVLAERLGFEPRELALYGFQGRTKAVVGVRRRSG
jgi:hypothetical protein